MGYVSLKVFDVLRKATVAKDSAGLIVRADSQFPIIACLSSWATADGEWTTKTVSDVKREKVSFHCVALEALRSKASELGVTAIDWERKLKVIYLQTALVELTGEKPGTTDPE